MLELSFRQTPAEQMVRIAASLVFGTLRTSGCKMVPLSSLAEDPQYGFTASAAVEPVGPKFVRITDLQDGQIVWDSVPYCVCPEPQNYLLRTGDILFARTGATTGKTHLVEDAPESVFASYLIRVRPRSGLRADYLYGFFQSDAYWSQIIKGKEGSAQPNVNGGKLSAILVPAQDLPFQACIVTFLNAVRARQDGIPVELPLLPSPLSGLQATIERLEGIRRKLFQLSVLRLKTDGEIAALSFATTNNLLAASASHWPTQVLGDIAEIRAGVTLGRKLAGNTLRVPYLRVANVQDGRLDLREMKEVAILPDELDKWKLLPGDILLTEGGDWDKLGRGTVWQGEISDCIHQNHIFRLRVDQARFDPYFLITQIGSPDGKAYFQRAAKQTTNLASINQRQLKQFKVFSPSLAEQRAIVGKVRELGERFRTLEHLAATRKDQIHALDRSILNSAFAKGDRSSRIGMSIP